MLLLSYYKYHDSGCKSNETHRFKFLLVCHINWVISQKQKAEKCRRTFSTERNGTIQEIIHIGLNNFPIYSSISKKGNWHLLIDILCNQFRQQYLSFSFRRQILKKVEFPDLLKCYMLHGGVDFKMIKFLRKLR